MSKFKGLIKEFPDIRVDYFRQSANPNNPPPRACFLSHIHSDHIQGLEGAYNAPFIYCSAATKELLVKLERRVHRLNWQKKIVESHSCRYKEKKRLLKAIPLETPTWVEIGHDQRLRVTLFDANHCVGAVMFLIEEGKPNGKAVLYTGDIRAEDWWVENLKRHPVLAPYTAGIKTLDRIYLDTSWGWRGYEKFIPKRDGLNELIGKMKRYPDNIRFHFNTWTFGYEEVWVALAAAFNSKIHLTPYHYRLFKSLSKADQWIHGPFLCGFELGNSDHPGVITTNPDVRIHSCERELDCPGLREGDVVHITPIVARIEGIELAEDAIDFGDLSSNDDFSLQGQLNDLLDIIGPTTEPDIRQLLADAANSRKESLPMPNSYGGNEDIALPTLLSMFADEAKARSAQRKDTQGDGMWPETTPIRTSSGEDLPTWIKFPYSRHSSLGELRNFVGTFRPVDVYPCVVDNQNWTERDSIGALFGDLCSGKVFPHDEEMRTIQKQREYENEQWGERLQEMEGVSQAINDVAYKGLGTQEFEEQEKKARASAMELDKSFPLPSEHMLLQNQSRLTISKGESRPKGLSQSLSLGDVLKLENLTSQASDTERYHSPLIPAQSEFPTEKPTTGPSTPLRKFTSLKRPSQSFTPSNNQNISKKAKTFPSPAPSIAKEDTDDIFTPLGKKTESKGSAEKLNLEGNSQRGGVRRKIGGVCGINPNSPFTEDEPRRNSDPIISSNNINDSKTPSKISATSCLLRSVPKDTLQSGSTGSRINNTTVKSPSKLTATQSSTNSVLSDARTGTFHTERLRNKSTSSPPSSASFTQPFTQSLHTCIIDLTSSPSQPPTHTSPSRSLSATPIPLLHHTSELITEICLELDDLDAELVLEATKAALGVDGRSWWDVGLKSCQEAVVETEL